jgi:hypothetical protein
MRHSVAPRAATDNAMAFMTAVRRSWAKDIPVLQAEPDRAKRKRVKIALTSGTAVVDTKTRSDAVEP